MNKRFILISLVLLFVLVLCSCGIYEKCPGEGGVVEKTQTNVPYLNVSLVAMRNVPDSNIIKGNGLTRRRLSKIPWETSVLSLLVAFAGYSEIYDSKHRS